MFLKKKQRKLEASISIRLGFIAICYTEPLAWTPCISVIMFTRSVHNLERLFQYANIYKLIDKNATICWHEERELEALRT